MINDNSYPIVLIPYGLNSISDDTPPAPPKPVEPKLVLPKEPIEPNHKADETSLSATPYIIGVIVILVSLITQAYWIMIIYASIVIFVLIMSSSEDKAKKIRREKEYDEYWLQRRTFSDRVKAAKNTFEDNLLQYRKELDKYNIDIQLVRDKDYVKEYRRKCLLEFYSTITKPEKTQVVYSQGISEGLFRKFLIEYFGAFIHDNFTIYDDEVFKERVYKPDFVFIDENSIIIDIEIDEPYIMSTGEPIHCDSVDSRRDEFFYCNNWLVIRFAEIQIVKHPESCCYLIAETIFNTTGNSAFLDKFTKKLSLESIPRWTSSESHKMAYKRFRNTYLGDELVSLAQKHEKVDNITVPVNLNQKYQEKDNIPFPYYENHEKQNKSNSKSSYKKDSSLIQEFQEQNKKDETLNKMLQEQKILYRILNEIPDDIESQEVFLYLNDEIIYDEQIKIKIEDAFDDIEYDIFNKFPDKFINQKAQEIKQVLKSRIEEKILQLEITLEVDYNIGKQKKDDIPTSEI